MNRNIKVLVVTGQYPDSFNPLINIFIKEQVDSLIERYQDLEIQVFNIHTEINKLNYLKRRSKFKQFVNQNNFDIVHYHYGLTALIGLNQNIKAKQIITFHGSDLNMVMLHRIVSKLAVMQFDHSIVVSVPLLNEIKFRNHSVISCGVNTDLFRPMDKTECRRLLGLPVEKKLILFPGAKTNPIKNFKFLERVLLHLDKEKFEVIELKNIQRKDVPLFLNSADVVTLTSLNEGSPQVLKEAAFCRVPIVTVDVVDVAFILEGSNNSHIVERDEKLFAQKIIQVVEQPGNSGFKNLEGFDSEVISSKIYTLYTSLISP